MCNIHVRLLKNGCIVLKFNLSKDITPTFSTIIMGLTTVSDSVFSLGVGLRGLWLSLGFCGAGLSPLGYGLGGVKMQTQLILEI